MTLAVRIGDLATRVATECKALRTLINGNTASLSSLSTTNKSNLVASINELHTAIQTLSSGSVSINDAATSTSTVWSASKVASEIEAARNSLLDGAASALDTLAELATALGNDANFASTVTTALANRIRYDAAQALTAPQQAQACANMGVGDPETNFVTTFNSGLV